MRWTSVTAPLAPSAEWPRHRRLAAGWAWAIAASAALTSCAGDGVLMPGNERMGAPYTIKGWVMYADGRRIEDATVEILDGPHAGATTVTDAAGQYKFLQPFTEVPRMRAAKTNFVVDHQAAYLVAARSIIEAWFRLSPVAPLEMVGDYTLTFTADATCTNLPEAARQRTYQTTVGLAARQTISLGGAAFVTAAGHTFNQLTFEAAEDRVTLFFGHADIWEQLAGNGSVYLTGSAEGAFTGAVSELRFGGGMGFCGVTGPEFRCDEHVPCLSVDHTVTMTRR